MERLLNECTQNPKSYSPAALAFIGDGVYGLLVREALLCNGNCPAEKLHNKSVALVKCQAQAAAADIIIGLLSENELSVYKRGRNHSTSHVPKNASGCDYQKATALECLFGYLYLCGEIERIRELFLAVTQDELYCTAISQ